MLNIKPLKVLSISFLYIFPLVTDYHYIKVHILLAEDNHVNQRVATNLLGYFGCILTLATNGLEAVEAAESNCFNMILMDEQMPVMGGYEAVALIREQEKTLGKHTPIIAMSSNPQREQILAAGMDDYLGKPYCLDLLKPMIQKFASPFSHIQRPL